jgi:hypothetical protein
MLNSLANLHRGNVIRLPVRAAVPGFTSRDLMDLQHWHCAGRRLEIDKLVEGIGQYAMIYRDDEPWASWAIAREAGRILVWDCISLADLGRFDCMQDALAAVPGANRAAKQPVSAQIIPFSAVRAQFSAAGANLQG